MNHPDKYNTIGNSYNTTRKADPYLLSRLTDLLGNIDHVLDIGSGTGNYTIALSQKGYNMIGVEPSEVMINEAKRRSEKVKWIQGTAEELHLNEQFDGTLATLTLHHWNDITKGLSKVKEQLKPGFPIVIFTSSPEQMSTYWLHEYFPKMMADSSLNMPTTETVKSALANAGFTHIQEEKYFIKPDLQDQFLQCGKDQPELYFNPEIRNGISSFRSFSYTDEVDAGLAKLKSDIQSGRWQDIRQRYESNLGDYLFIKAIS